jgi:predicted transport protein
VTKDQTIRAVSEEVKKYSVEDHFTEGREKSLGIYEAFKKRIMDFDSRIAENPRKYYIGFKIAKQNMFDINSISRTKINLALYRVKPSDLKDPEQRTVYRKNCMQYYNKHISDFEIKSTEDIDYAVFLARQVYERYFK